MPSDSSPRRLHAAAALTALALALLAAGCAGRHPVRGPIVDLKGVDRQQYHTDLADCERYADQVAVGAQAATGAVAGAVVGGLIGAAAGDSDTAKRSAGAGAVIGGARGTAGGIEERHRVVRNCLINRGYAVLN
ncbi:MAG: hypothetical protein R3E86_04750 [Pseudomonadales bacterium]